MPSRKPRGEYSSHIMERRDFLRMISAAPLVTTATTATPATPPAAATVLYDDRAGPLAKLGTDPRGATEALWMRKAEVPRGNDFELKPQGACRADMCVPIPKD